MTNPVIANIHARRSVGKLSLPVPSQAELDIVLKAAIAAPDHKQLKPWKFWVLTGNALNELGQVLEQAAQYLADKKGETLDEATLNKTRNMPLRAPMIIVIAISPKYHEKVPEYEQLLSAGASAQNMLLALESLGYRSVWRSGPLSETAIVKSHFGLAESDTICGLLYVGSSDIQMPERVLSLDGMVTYRD